jgi:purine nucleosidase
MKNIKKKVIIDTDMGWDDVLSILYLMKNPTIEIVGKIKTLEEY